MIKEPKPRQKDFWDILSALTPLILGIAVTGVGAFFTQIYNFRQMKLNEIQALERFRPQLSSKEEGERAFAYNCFRVLGYERLALELIKYNKDQAGVPLAEELAKSKDTSIRDSAANTLEVLSQADKFITKYEGTSIEDPRYQQPEAIKISKELGIKSGLGMLIIHDTLVQSGRTSINRFSALATKEMSGTPKNGISEKEWLLRFLQARKVNLYKFESKFGKVMSKRVDELISLVQQDDRNLITIK